MPKGMHRESQSLKSIIKLEADHQPTELMPASVGSVDGNISSCWAARESRCVTTQMPYNRRFPAIRSEILSMFAKQCTACSETER